MYPTVSNEFHKSPPPSAPPAPPPPYHEPPATGIPVVQPPLNYSYGGDYSQNPTPPHHQHQIRADDFPSGLPRNWSSGLCHCCSDCSSCCMTCWCPCVTFGQVSEIIDKGSSSCVVNASLYGLICYFSGCACLYSFFYRTKMRKQYGLPESPCNDFLVHCCCECCALCQEYRHLKSLGFDLSIGWHGNMEQQNQGGIRPPVVPHGMSR